MYLKLNNKANFKSSLKKHNINWIFILVMLIILISLVVIFINVNSMSNNNNQENNDNNTNTEETDKTPEFTGAELGSYTHTDTRLVISNSANNIKPDRHVCYLTFDDGPSTNTERILEILDKHNIKATWFVKADNQNIDKAKKIWEKGNQVAVHTFTHDYNKIYSSTDAFWNDYNKAYNTLEQALGFKPANMFRFPGGSVNSYNKKIAKNLMAQAAQKNIHYFDWNQSCGDGANHSADELVFYATDGAAKLNSVCLLMHDSQAKDTTVDALDRIIQFYKDNGFSFEYLNEESYSYAL